MSGYICSVLRPASTAPRRMGSSKGHTRSAAGAKQCAFARLRHASTTVALACVVAICAIPLSASSAQTTSQTLAEQPALQEDFAAQFREVVEPLGPDYQDADLNIPADAVDLDTFEPPIEIPPPEPTSGAVIRSLGTGVASYYGRRFHGRLTANGERFNMNAMTAAHKTLPFGTLVRVTNPRNGRSVTVRINDRGPFIRGRTIDLSRGAAQRIGMIASGHARVQLDIVAR